jgi:hypothetical protein
LLLVRIRKPFCNGKALRQAQGERIGYYRSW